MLYHPYEWRRSEKNKKEIERRRGREIRYELVKYSEPVGEGAHSVGTKEVGARVLGERSHARQQG